MANSSIWSPTEWKTASDYYSNMLGGTSGALQTATNQATKMAGSDYYNNLWKSQSKNLMDTWSKKSKELAEGYAPGGVGSSALGRNIAQTGSDLYNSLYPSFLSSMLGGQQNAISQLSNIANIGQGAASGLTNVGSLTAELPMQVASAMGNIGQSQTSQSVSPYLSMLSSLLGSGTTQTQYQPSTLTNILGSLGGVDWGSLFGGGGSSSSSGPLGSFVSNNVSSLLG